MSTLSFMQLSENDIREFRDIWREELNETLSPEEAQREASLLVELYASIADITCQHPPETNGK